MQASLEPLRVGEGKICCEGNAIAIVAIGSRVGPALEAAQILDEEGIAATVVDARFVKPLDEALILRLADELGRIVTVEENAQAGGFGSQVAELLSDHDRQEVHLVRLGIPDEFVTLGDTERLRAEAGIDAQAIAQAARKLCRSPQAVSASD